MRLGRGRGRRPSRLGSGSGGTGRAGPPVDELFEHRLRRDLRRLADGLVAGPRASLAADGSRSWRWSPGAKGRIRPRAAWSPSAGWLMLGLWVAVAAILVAAGAVVGRTVGQPSDVGPLARATAALAGTAGSLAYESGTGLYAAEPGSAPQRIATVGVPGSAPQWSPDGAWLAYLGTGNLLHVVQAGGGDDHLVVPVPVTAMTWSPTADLLAVVPAAGADRGDLLLVPVPPAVPGLPAVAPSAPTLVATDVVSFVWSATGTRIAYVVGGVPGGRDQVRVTDVVTKTVTVLPFVAPVGTGLLLAGWWPDGSGLLLWEDPGRSLAAEATGLWLWALPLHAAQATPLARTFVYLPWLAWSPNGRQLALVAMPGAFPWQSSQVEVCSVAPERCRALAQPAGTVSLDPTWSPGGRRLAFVRAPALAGGTSTGALSDWYGERRLWVAPAAGGAASPVAGAPAGVADPRFGLGGRTITVATNHAIVVVPLHGGRPTVVAGGLDGALDTAGPDGYGKLPWGGLVVWGP